MPKKDTYTVEVFKGCCKRYRYHNTQKYLKILSLRPVRVHCPKTHEKFPSSFGNAEVISSDRRKLFINILSKTIGNCS
jgi:hypothetical protein